MKIQGRSAMVGNKRWLDVAVAVSRRARSATYRSVGMLVHVSMRAVLSAALSTAVSLVLCTPSYAQDASCRYVKLGTLPVTFNNYRPTVVGSLEDKPAVMLIDSGAFRTALTLDSAQRFGLNYRKTINAGSMIGIGGETDMYYTRINSIAIGGIKGGRQDMPTAAEASGTKGVDAMVGADFLHQADVEFNLSKPEISFFQPIDCGKAFLAYWDAGAFYVDAHRISRDDRRIMFTVQVNGHGVDAIIDSGAGMSLIDAKTAEDMGITIGNGMVKVGKTSGVGLNSADVYLATFDTITIGAETLHKPRVAVADLSGGNSSAALFQPKMLLGADFLKAHRVLFAVSQNRIYISYVGGPVFATDRKPVARDSSASALATEPKPDPSASTAPGSSPGTSPGTSPSAAAKPGSSASPSSTAP